MSDSIKPSALPEGMIVEFRTFVEWILEVDLTTDQEEALRTVLTEEWAEDVYEFLDTRPYNGDTGAAERDALAWIESYDPDKFLSWDGGFSLGIKSGQYRLTEIIKGI